MKNSLNKKIFLGILSLSILTACTKFLDEPQELDVTANDIDYTSQAGAYGALVGAYSTFQDVGWEQIPLISVLGDDVNAGGLGDQQPFSDTDKYLYDKGYWMYNSLWSTWYQDILQETVQIEQLSKYKQAGVNASLVNQYQAEIMVMRGYQTLELAKLFGAAFKVESSDQTKLTVLSKDEIMQWISDQMDAALPNLLDKAPNQRTDLPGGVTKYTALAVKAMANQEIKNYAAVANATGQIINSAKFELFSDYYQLFKIPGKLCSENLWEIQYSDFGQGSGTNSSHLFAFYGPTSWTPVVSTAGAGWGFFEPSMKYIKFMLTRGEKTRLQTSVLFTDRGIAAIKADPLFATLPAWVSNTTPSGDKINDYPRAMFASGKHYLPSNQLTSGRTDYGTNKNYTIIRYAEILLMYAEAVTRGATASAGSADKAVNLVRTRAGLAPLTGVTTAMVLDEKYAEMAMEWGVRYFDMVRTENTAALSYDGRTFNLSKKYLPFPQAQLDISPILKAYYDAHQ